MTPSDDRSAAWREGLNRPGIQSPTYGEALCQAGAVLRRAGIAEARMEARLLLGSVAGLDAAALLARRHDPLPAEADARLRTALARRAGGEPMAHITGRQGFWTLDIMVSPDTLIPRADSEALVEAALEAFPDPARPLRVLDLGTGTGCLLLAVLAERPAAFGLGIDLSPGAAALAAANAVANGLAPRAAFLAGDWADAIAGRFDLVLSNPPYIETAVIPLLAPEVARHEPARALDGGADGLDAYRAITAALPRLLAPGGVAVLELGHWDGQGQGPAVAALGRAAGLAVRGIRADLGGIERALVLAATG